MIKIDDSRVQFKGNVTQISFEFVMLLDSLRTFLAQETGSEKVAEKIIADLGAIAFEKDENWKQAMEDRAVQLHELLIEEGLVEEGEK